MEKDPKNHKQAELTAIRIYCIGVCMNFSSLSLKVIDVNTLTRILVNFILNCI
jgi:hypothetical protein